MPKLTVDAATRRTVALSYLEVVSAFPLGTDSRVPGGLAWHGAAWPVLMLGLPAKFRPASSCAGLPAWRLVVLDMPGDLTGIMKNGPLTCQPHCEAANAMTVSSRTVVAECLDSYGVTTGVSGVTGPEACSPAPTMRRHKSVSGLGMLSQMQSAKSEEV